MVFGALPFVWRFAFRRGKGIVASGDGFLGHLTELRERLVRVLSWTVGAWFLMGAVAGWGAESVFGGLVFAGWGRIYEILVTPMAETLKTESGSIIAIGAISPLIAPAKAAFFVAICVLMPYILYEIWGFVAPGLYENEKKLALPLVTTSALLFYAGIAFAYFAFYVIFGFIAQITPDAVAWSPDINELLGFMLIIFFVSGLVFEVPVAVFILVRAGVVELETLRRARPYVIVGAFVVAAIVTPPDIFSQFLLAIPCWLLYEVGLWFTSKWGVKKEESKNKDGGKGK